jgi:hypothetical protein
MFPTAAAHIVDMPRAAPRLVSIASPDSVSELSCPSSGEAQNITHDALNITFSQPCEMSSLYAPNTYIWYSKKKVEAIASQERAIASLYLGKGKKSFDLESAVRSP